ncbi:MAG: branched-chain amino acid ABC transporter permease [Bacteroidales bacterium]|nr:branched-chain amino acid ABC transporter permease [Bacteroidales bacterium]
MLQNLLDGLLTGILCSLFAAGFAIVYNMTRVFHIAAAGVYVFAGFLFHYLVSDVGVPFWLAGLAAVLAAALLNAVCDWAVYRPLSKRHASSNSLIIASVGLMTVLINLLAISFGNDVKTIKHPFNHPVYLATAMWTTGQQIQFVVGGLVLLVLLSVLVWTPVGMRLRASSFNGELYESFGYSSWRARSFAFLVGGALTAVAACLNAYEVTFSLDMGFNLLVGAVVATIIGGTGRLEAAVLGGLVVGLLEGVLRKVPLFAAHDQWIMAILMVVLLVFLFFRPQGLVGIKMRDV